LGLVDVGFRQKEQAPDSYGEYWEGSRSKMWNNDVMRSNQDLPGPDIVTDAT